MRLEKDSFLLKMNRVILGSFLLLFGIATILSVVTFNPQDPSFFNATDILVIHNKLGFYGALISDVFIQIYGIASFLVAASISKLGYDLLKKTRSKLLVIKFLFFPILVFSASLILYPVSLPESFISVSGGGWIGKFLYDSWTSFIDIKYAYYTCLLLLATSIIILFDLKISSIAFILYGLINKVLNKKKRYIKINNTNNDYAYEELQEQEIFTTEKENINSKKKPINSLVKKTISKPSISMPEEVKYILPTINILNIAKNNNVKLSPQYLEEQRNMLSIVLEDFGIKGSITNVKPGPVVTLFELEPAAGTKSSRIIGLSDDIARSMSALSARIAVIPGRNLIGIEIPNKTRETVFLRELLDSQGFKDSSAALPIALGKNIGGDSVIVDLAKMPHLLVAGTTGSGKSVAINVMILSLLYKLTPDQCRFIMIDPKMLELSVYDGIPHLLTPVVTEPGKAVAALKWVVKEMENRYKLMSGIGVRNINNYNDRVKEAKNSNKTLNRTVQTGFDQETGNPIFETVEIETKELPLIVVIVDEMADLMIVAGKDIEASIQRLAQMARAAGIHIIMATQRPSVDVITGVIKANFPTRISFQVTSKIDSRTILGEQGAEQLLGMGDMLYMAGGSKIMRVHAPFVTDMEVENVVTELKKNTKPEYNDDIIQVMEDSNSTSSGYSGISDSSENSKDDELYNQAVEIVVRDKKASTSYVQRCLRIGYNRAAILIERMEKEGIVSLPNHSGKREILTSD